MPTPKLYPLPREVADIVRAQENSISNFGLLFHRLVGYPSPSWQMEGTNKSEAWREMIGQAKRIYRTSEMRALFESLKQRRRHVEAGLRRQFGPEGIVTFRMEAETRLVIGLSAPSVLDTGISLHRIYGFPYLPGEGVKGTVRHFRLSEISEALGIVPLSPEEIEARRETPWQMLEDLLTAREPADAGDREKLQGKFEKLAGDDSLVEGEIREGKIKSFQDLRRHTALGAESFRRAFGSTEGRGEVTFFDAYPEDLVVAGPQGNPEPILELDILNPHYQEYYTGDSPPADYLSPVPVLFPTIRAGTRFCFMLACQDTDLLALAARWVRETAQILGLGAKRSAGYGAMRPI